MKHWEVQEGKCHCFSAKVFPDKEQNGGHHKKTSGIELVCTSKRLVVLGARMYICELEFEQVRKGPTKGVIHLFCC